MAWTLRDFGFHSLACLCCAFLSFDFDCHWFHIRVERFLTPAENIRFDGFISFSS